MAGGDYGRIRHTFWSDPEIKRALTAEQKALLLYYFTNPHCNMIGLYYCPLEYAASEVGLSLSDVQAWVYGPLARFLTYDPSTEEVLVHRMARHQIDRELKESDKRVGRVRRDLAGARSGALVQRFAALYPDWPHGIETMPPPSGDDGATREAPSDLERGGINAPEAPSEPLPSPFEAKAVAVAEQGKAEKNSTLRVGAASGADPASGDLDGETSTEPPATTTPTGTAIAVLGSGALPAERDPERRASIDADAGPPGVIPLRAVRTVEEAVRALVPVSGDRVSGAQVLHAWLSMQPRQLSRGERERFGGVAKRLADQHAPVEIAAGFVGMGQIAPHCAPFNEPWDLIQLQQKFSRAAAAALNHPALKAQREQDDLERALERRMTRRA